jgi:hypothetical protein
MPFTYLGIPITHRRWKNSEWQDVIARFEKRLSNWKAKILSLGGRLVLINSVLSSLPIFMMSLLYYLDSFGKEDTTKINTDSSSGKIICQPKELGGLGVANIAIKNICLLNEWLFKLLNEDGICQQILKNKYLGTKALTMVSRRPGDSQFWSGLMNVKYDFLCWGQFRIVDGQSTRFWEDIWIINKTLKEQCPNLFNVVRNKTTLVADVLLGAIPNLTFR